MIARNLPSRRTILGYISRETNAEVTRDQAIRIICLRHGWHMAAIREIAKQLPTGRRPGTVSKTAKVYVPKPVEQCRCGAVEVLVTRLRQRVCRECAAMLAGQKRIDPTPEQIAAECAALIAKNPRNPQGYTEHPAEVAIVQQLGVLHGRAGSWSAYE